MKNSAILLIGAMLFWFATVYGLAALGEPQSRWIMTMIGVLD